MKRSDDGDVFLCIQTLVLGVYSIEYLNYVRQAKLRRLSLYGRIEKKTY